MFIAGPLWLHATEESGTGSPYAGLEGCKSLVSSPTHTMIIMGILRQVVLPWQIAGMNLSICDPKISICV